MTVILLPRIAAHNYEAIRSLLNRHVPNSHNEWLDLRDQWLKEYASDTIIHVDVNPDKFSKYLERTGRAHDLKALIDFVAEIDAD